MKRLAAIVLILLSGCSETLDREEDNGNAIAREASDIANKADAQVNATIAKMGPLENTHASDGDSDNTDDKDNADNMRNAADGSARN